MGQLTVEDARAILARHRVPVRTFVETGTHRGTTLFPIVHARIFEHVHSIDLSPFHHGRAREALSDREEVALHLGDSRLVVPALAKSIAEPAFFWLDAHWYDDGPETLGGDCPLFEELEAIRARDYPDVVVIDDMQCFGRKWGEDPRSDWTRITETSILNALGDRWSSSYAFDFKFVVYLRGAAPRGLES